MATKITEKTSKQGLVKMLKSAVESLTDANLKERVQYTLKKFAEEQSKVGKADLFDLAKEVESLLPAPAATPVEASLKPKKLGKKSTLKEESKEETSDEDSDDDSNEEEETPAEAPAPAPKKTPAKKNGASKSASKSSPKGNAKKSEVDTIPAASNVGVDRLPSAKMFPAEIDHPDLGKLIACTGDYTTYQDVFDALEAEKTLYFACYWTKRQIREYQYATAKMIKPETVKNGFPLDLDILMAVLPCETMERVFAMSRYTEALFQFEGEDFKPVEDTDPRSGDKFQIRVSAGMEFEIYRPANEEVLKK